MQHLGFLDFQRDKGEQIPIRDNHVGRFAHRTTVGIVQWLAFAGIPALFTLALMWIAVIPGLTAKLVNAATRAFADNEPLTSIVNSIRSLLSSQPVGSDIWVALTWCAGITIVAWFFAMRAYRRVA